MKKKLAHWAGRVWGYDNPIPSDEELWSFDIFRLESQFRQYMRTHSPDLFDDGMTIDEIWVSQQLYSARPLTFLVSSRFRSQVSDKVRHKAFPKSDALIWILAALFMESEPGSAKNVIITNGVVGHTINIRGLNGVDFRHPRDGKRISKGWFSFHDPWPARSLLASKSDFPMIEVLEDVTHPPFWLISPGDLEKIIVGFIIYPNMTGLLADFFRVLAILQKKQPAGIPLWLENEMKAQHPFPLLFAMHGNITPTTFETTLGLAQFNLLCGDAKRAEQVLGLAYELMPKQSTKQTIIEILEHFGETDLAMKWRIDE